MSSETEPARDSIAAASADRYDPMVNPTGVDVNYGPQIDPLGIVEDTDAPVTAGSISPQINPVG